MSKVEVKVKKGDRWAVSRKGELILVYQSNSSKAIADEETILHGPSSPVVAYTPPGVNFIAARIARAWIESLGGAVVEEAEEVKGGTHTMHVYKFRSDGSLAFFDRKHQFQTADYLGTTIIHIAGVTT